MTAVAASRERWRQHRHDIQHAPVLHAYNPSQAAKPKAALLFVGDVTMQVQFKMAYAPSLPART